MGEGNRAITKAEANEIMAARIDLASGDIGYAVGMMVMALLTRPPKPSDTPEEHAALLRTLELVANTQHGLPRLAARQFLEAIRVNLTPIGGAH